MSQELNVLDFFQGDYVNYGSYDNYRKIACYIDGLKPSARKALYTMIEQNINSPIKVNSCASKISEFTNYLHGQPSIEGVIVGCAQNFVGSNNIPLFQRDGNFGSRFETQPSASRYIKTQKEKYLDKIFKVEDNNILEEQIFEGDKIEPKYYLPVIPMLLINGSEGLSTGFAQKILPRNPKQIKDYLINILSGQKTKPLSSLNPFFKGFKGKIKKAENDNSWEILGSIQKQNANTYIITEIPIGYDLNDYIKVLDDLEEKGTIKSYSDLSTDDKFKFEIKFTRGTTFKINKEDKTLDQISEAELLSILKLVKKVTENYTCSNESLSITEFSSVDEIIEDYIDIKKIYLKKRKDFLLKKLYYDIVINASKYFFIKGVVEDTIKIRNIKYDDIIEQLKTNNNIKTDKNNSYDYLLNMAVHSLTKEKYEALKLLINKLKEQYKNLEKKTIEEIWIEELNELTPVIEGLVK